MRHNTAFSIWLIAAVVRPTGGIVAAPREAWRTQLPSDAVVLETRPLPSQRHANRTLALWMSHPTKHPNSTPRCFPYTCSEWTRGSYLHGPARVSLVDLKRQRILNTIEIKGTDEDGGLDLPYKIRAGYYYPVSGNGKGERPPIIMRLRDYNGDGTALEFALFDADGCSMLWTTLVGYSERHDQVLQYPIELGVREGANDTSSTVYWVDQLFWKPPLQPGRWQYTLEYPGSETRYEYTIRYDQESERFRGTETLNPLPQ
jgi:hypothetical protein